MHMKNGIVKGSEFLTLYYLLGIFISNVSAYFTLTHMSVGMQYVVISFDTR